MASGKGGNMETWTALFMNGPQDQIYNGEESLSFKDPRALGPSNDGS